jgi:uncharacterized protein (DUF427 family)
MMRDRHEPEHHNESSPGQAHRRTKQRHHRSAWYSYFPSTSVRLDWLEKAPKTEDDLKCPHGVQFFDLVVDGKRHERAAWSYEKPQPKMQHVGGRFGFWGDVTVS